MAAETGFIINDVRHEVPTLDTFTMDEAQVLYDYCGLTIEDFIPLAAQADEDEEALAELDRKLRNPGFLRALMHVAYQRANPKLSTNRVREAIGSADLLGNLEALLPEVEEKQEEADPDLPPASATEPERSSNESSVDSENKPEPSGEPGGNSSRNGSDGQDAAQPITTTFESEASLDSPRISLAK